MNAARHPYRLLIVCLILPGFIGMITTLSGMVSASATVTYPLPTPGENLPFDQRQMLSPEIFPGTGIGYGLALSGNYAFIGAHTENYAGPVSGVVYVYRRVNGRWVRDSLLAGHDTSHHDWFGYTIVMAGDTAVVGAYNHRTTGSNNGAVYIFTLVDDHWQESQKLVPSDPGDADRFGITLALDGDTLLIGAHQADDGRGAVYVFERSDHRWTERQKLTASDAQMWHYFGDAIALDGDTALIGAFQAGDTLPPQGAAYIFTRQDGVWVEQQRLAADPLPLNSQSPGEFGKQVALKGKTAWVSDPARDHDRGTVYIYQFTGTTWQNIQQLDAPDEISQRFGRTLTFTGDTAWIGVTSPNTIIAYRYHEYQWREAQRLTPAGTGSDVGTGFGWSLAVDGERMLIGAIDFLQPPPGRVFAFETMLSPVPASLAMFAPFERIFPPPDAPDPYQP